MLHQSVYNFAAPLLPLIRILPTLAQDALATRFRSLGHEVHYGVGDVLRGVHRHTGGDERLFDRGLGYGLRSGDVRQRRRDQGSHRDGRRDTRDVDPLGGGEEAHRTDQTNAAVFGSVVTIVSGFLRSVHVTRVVCSS
ncbi:BQ5605_C003g02296 [Microbotryum silenes-dioicae]|uniref:BQ5605_C003g02296 protein n=1 Tax=Microbotryum silenes-dioicae TaxID=796604 RepID=A0A2X0NYI6_9BASI|nr:BQ5605_C003g02296 [Microbotryum silenes-dioicae]